MANPWFRMYGEFATDPKVQMLSEAEQRRLTMLFCLRCNGHVTLHDEEVTFLLRISNDEWQVTKALFIAKGFINKDNEILNWDKRQFTSDTSKNRVAAYRERKKQDSNNDVTLQKQKSNAIDTDTDTDTDKSLGDEKPVTPKSKGKVLPSDWVLPKAWGEWALQNKPEFNAEQIRAISEIFKDHWIANSNQANAKKSDWEATWRNWVRKQTAPPVITDKTQKPSWLKV
jgi:hypothetical protein